MSDPSSNKPSILSWQRAQPSSSSPSSSSTSDSDSASTSESSSPQSQPPPSTNSDAIPSTSVDGSRSEEFSQIKLQEENLALLSQAKKFLEQDDVRDAPVARKRSFLEGKGVKSEDIDILLKAEEERIASLHKPSTEAQAVLKDEEATSTCTETGATGRTQPAPTSTSIPRKEAMTRQTSVSAPPIVTYPEFLTQPTKPPPLVTASRLINTAYLAGGITATLYGLSRWVVNPMVSNLSEARGDFAAFTGEKLAGLNEKLGEVVSVDPGEKGAGRRKGGGEGDDDEEEGGELLEQDGLGDAEGEKKSAATQTTPPLTRRTSSDNLLPPPSTEAGHVSRVDLLRTHLSDINDSLTQNYTSHSSLSSTLDDLTSYLNEIRYARQSSTWADGRWESKKDGKEGDGAEEFRREIRGVKGVLLSARNFPRGPPAQQAVR